VQMFMLPEDAKDKRATQALLADRVRGLRLRDVSVRWDDETEPMWESALVLRRVSDFRIDTFSGRQGLPGGDAPTILLDDSNDGVIVNSQALEGCRRFVHVRGDATQDIRLRDNRMKGSGDLLTFEQDALRQRVDVG
jgi:hypothetical protein